MSLLQTSGVIGVNTANEDDSALHNLGMTVTGTDGQTWLYGKTGSSITKYSYVTIDEDNVISEGTKAAVDDGHRIGFAQIAASAADKYMWVACQGSNITARTASGTTVDSALYTTATAGILGSTASSQTKIDGIVAVTAASASAVTNVELIASYPKSTTF